MKPTLVESMLLVSERAPPLPGAEKIQYVQMEVLEAKAFEEKKKEFGKIVLR